MRHIFLIMLFGMTLSLTAQQNVINIEVDWLEAGDHDHRLEDCEMQAVVDAFAINGWVLNIEFSNAIPEDAANVVLDMTMSPFSLNPEWAALATAHRDHAAGTGWHYAVLGHEYDAGFGVGSSGLAEIDGDEFLVTLGGAWPGNVGLPFQRSGTFMHELGHNLGLRHGGNEDSNFKPNYVSIMNYLYQLGGVRSMIECRDWADPDEAPLFILDYSHGNQAAIDENNLVEQTGIGYGSIDWDCDNQIDANPYAHSISGNHPFGTNWCDSPETPRMIADYNDWSNIGSNARSVTSGEEMVSCISVSYFNAIDPCRVPGMVNIPDPCNLSQDHDLLSVVIDRTGSMNVGGPPDRCMVAETRAIETIQEFEAMFPNGLVSVWTFSDNDVTQLTLGYVDAMTARNAVNMIGGCNGATPLADALCTAIDSLAAANGRSRRLRFLTDGDENNSKGECAGPASVSPNPPYDTGSWHRMVRDKAIAEDVTVDVDFYGSTVSGPIDVETGETRNQRLVADTDFFAELATVTGGSFAFFDDDLLGVPTLSGWALLILVFGLAVAMLYLSKRGRAPNVT